jgi:hypothetical protein
MKRAALLPAFGACLSTLFFASAFAQVDIRSNPWSPLSAGSWVSGAGPAVENQNFAVMTKRQEQMRQFLLSEDMMADQGAGGGLQPPVMSVVPNQSEDAVPLIAERAQAQYFPGVPVAKIESYMRARVHDYVRTVKSEDMPELSLGSSCDYVVESLYAVGRNVAVDSGEGRRNVRGTCTVLVSALQAEGSLKTNAQRLTMLQFLAIAGGAYREMDARFTAAGNTAERAKNAADARKTFAALFNADIEKISPEQFPCIFAGKTLTCDTIMREGPPLFGKLIAKYP